VGLLDEAPVGCQRSHARRGRAPQSRALGVDAGNARVAWCQPALIHAIETRTGGSIGKVHSFPVQGLSSHCLVPESSVENRLRRFYRLASKLAYKWINRRSQKKSMSFAKYLRFLAYNPLPQPKIYHSLYTLSSC